MITALTDAFFFCKDNALMTDRTAQDDGCDQQHPEKETAAGLRGTHDGGP